MGPNNSKRVYLFDQSDEDDLQHTFISTTELGKNPRKIFFYVFVIVALVSTTILCLWRIEIIETHINNKFNYTSDSRLYTQHLSINFYWVLTALIVSLFSIFPLNYDSSRISGELKKEIEKLNSANKGADADKIVNSSMLITSKRLLSTSYVVTIITLLIIFLVLAIAIIHLSTDFSENKGPMLLTTMNILIVLYLPVMLFNDIFLFLAFKNLVNFHYSIKGNSLLETSDLRGITKELSIYGKLILFVDIPIIIGLAASFLTEHIVIDDLPSKILYSAGATAMHVIAANVISIFIDLSSAKRIE